MYSKKSIKKKKKVLCVVHIVLHYLIFKLVFKLFTIFS